MNNIPSLLKMNNISKSFSGVKVLKGVNIELKEKEILGLVGENGAGKSTLMNILSGILESDDGEMTYRGESFKPVNALEASKKGIAIIHQELSLFQNLSVAENIFIEDMPKKRATKVIDRKYIAKKAKEALAYLNANINVRAKIAELEMGKRQQVEIAKALIKNASIIIFDEPTTSLSNNEKENLFNVINNLRDSGVAIIYISHNLEEIFHLCDKITVMRDGVSFDSIKKKDCSKDQIVRMMVGRELKNYYPYKERSIGDSVLKVDRIKLKNSQEEINLAINKGEIIGMYGLMGAGRTELLRAIYGVDKKESGEVYINGKRIKKLNPLVLIKNGMAFLTENRGEEGLFLSRSVKDNLIITYLDELKKSFWAIDRKKEEQKSQDIIEKVKIKTHNKNKQTVRKLSGGNQQKVVFGKWLLIEPKIFLMDEPTRGIDVGAKYEIYNFINELAQKGSGVFIVSSEMEELMGICDKILVLKKGKITGELNRKDFSQESLIQLAL